MPKVSVLMPVYNVAPFLREAIDSILAQSFTDFELIILNDCSPDESGSIINTYSDPRIVRYTGEKNVGLANVLNIGLEMAKGEYVARMDSDDISFIDRLQVQYDYLQSHPGTDLVSAGMQKFGAANTVLSHNTSFEEVKFNAIFFSPVLHASSMWRRERFVAKNLYYRQEMVPVEDYDLWTRALLSGLVLDNIPDILYKYRIHSDQVTIANKDWSKARAISLSYLARIFPTATTTQVDELSRYLSEHDSARVKRLTVAFESLNGESGYFDGEWLHVYLTHNYQNALYNEMKSNGIVFSSLFELRIKQIIKLLCRKIRR